MSKSEERVNPPTKVTFLFNRPDDLKPIYVNGIYGGMTPKGELVCHFFLEMADIPLEEEVPLDKGRLQLDKITRVDRRKHDPTEIVMRRDIKATLIIPPQEIGSIANWMLDKMKASKIVVEKESTSQGEPMQE